MEPSIQLSKGSESILDEQVSSIQTAQRQRIPLFGIKAIACVILLALGSGTSLHSALLKYVNEQETSIVQVDQRNVSASQEDDEGYWVHSDEYPPPYTFSKRVCNNTYIHKDDCDKAANLCPSNLMNWDYVKSGKPYPKFNATGFLHKMKNKRVMFVGCSLMRQQILALMWTLGYDNIAWKKSTIGIKKKCTAGRHCFTDENFNITYCHQFMGSIATKVYHEGNYTLDHSLRGKGDSSCLLDDSNIASIGSFDLVLVQSVAWWTRLGVILDSPTSPKEWVHKMLPTVYYDAMKELLTKLSRQTKTVFVLGHIGADCKNKTLPEPFSVNNIPQNFGWDAAPTLWDTSLHLLLEERLDIKVVDAREPLMQSVHSHPEGDCLHFCMNSAAVNLYLDIYWNEVISQLWMDFEERD